jgi:cyclophilin family peptidyl-prolyl cis-trans isomerase/HEAT repeat protein
MTSDDARERWAATYCLMRLMGAPASGATPIAAVGPLDEATAERARRVLLDRLADPDPEIRLVAARGLRTVGDPETTNALLAHRDADWRVRVEVLRALAGGGAEGRGIHVADLTPYFEDEHQLVALTAIESLRRVGREADATRHLLGGVRSSDPRRVAASYRGLLARWSADSTFAEDAERVAQLERLTHYVLGRDEWSVQALAAEALPLLPDDQRGVVASELITRDPRVMKLSIAAAFDAAEGETFLDRARPFVTALVEHDDPVVHFMTWSALAGYAYEDSTGAVTERDRDQVDTWLADAFTRWSTPAGVDVRQTVVELFAIASDRPASKRALERAITDPSHAVRRAAAAALDLPMDAPPVTPVASKSGPTDYAPVARWADGEHWAVFSTEAGRLVARLYSREAPMTTWNFATLANAGFYDDGNWHRVVADFVLQNGCPRGDGWGGPDWAIRCEINPRRYEAGALGMALSGKDTGGSQYFFTHSAQPHLDGGYTVFGQLDADDRQIANRVLQGERIHWVRVVDVHPDVEPEGSAQ